MSCNYYQTKSLSQNRSQRDPGRAKLKYSDVVLSFLFHTSSYFSIIIEPRNRPLYHPSLLAKIPRTARSSESTRNYGLDLHESKAFAYMFTVVPLVHKYTRSLRDFS